MIEPKIFYRKLDSVLSRIGREKTGKDFLFTITEELVNTFEKDLCISNGRIYEESEDFYILMVPDGKEHLHKDNEPQLQLSSRGVQAILKNRRYIFDDPTLRLGCKNNTTGEYSIPAAMTVNSPDYRWILVFDLKSGWIREEIDFCFNAVRTALNYRLRSDAIRNEMEQAANIQLSLLPAALPQPEGYKIAALSMPAEAVGGDFYDYFTFNGSNFGLSIGDASGHGLPAALLVRDVVTGLRMGFGEDRHIINTTSRMNRFVHQRLSSVRMVNILKKLNRVIYKSTYSTRFVSLIYAEFDRRGQVKYANAGHPSAILIGSKGIKELEPTGPIFGALQEIEIQEGSINMLPGDILVMFSDGIPERMNSNNEEFGMSRLKEIIINNRAQDPDILLETIFYNAQTFGRSERWEDDATVVIIKRV